MEIQMERLIQIVGEQKIEKALLMDRVSILTNKKNALEKEIEALKKLVKKSN